MAKKSKRCKECGFRVRGKGHEDGPHHKGRLSQVRHAMKA